MIRLVHVQEKVPFHVECECDPRVACSEKVPFHVEGACDLCAACSENHTVSR